MTNQVAANFSARQITEAWIAGTMLTGTGWLDLYGLNLIDAEGWRKGGVAEIHPVTYEAFHDLLERSTAKEIDPAFTHRVYAAVEERQLLAARQVIKLLVQRSHRTAVSKGFWEDRTKDLSSTAGRMTALSELMLVTTELAEGAEGVRHGNPPDDKVPAYDSLTAESSDAIIRLLDMAGGHDLPLADCLIEKMAFNKGRSYKHGKEV